MREYLEPVDEVDERAQYVDDIGIAAKTSTYLIGRIRAVSKCIYKAEHKLAVEEPFRSHTFWIPWQDRLTGCSFTTRPQSQKVSEQIVIPEIENMELVNYYWSSIAEWSRKSIQSTKNPKQKCW